MKKKSKFMLVPMVDLGDVLGRESHFRLWTIWKDVGRDTVETVQSTISLCEALKAEVEGGDLNQKWFSDSREMTAEEAAATISELNNIVIGLQYTIEEFNSEKKGNDKLKLFCFFS